MQWVYLGIACAFEVAFVLSSRAARGYTRLWPSALNIAVAVVGVYTFSLALLKIDVSVAYAIWTGVGSLGSVAFGAWLYHERMTALKLASVCSIIIGVVGLHTLAAG